jgi:hypothetical protein
VEPELAAARAWQDDLRTATQRELVDADLTEPQQWYRDDQWNWRERTAEELDEASLRRQFNMRNMRYANWNDRRDRGTDVGYVHHIHQWYGLDVYMHIPRIEFTRANFGTPEEIENNDCRHNIFTEIRLTAGPHFVDLNSSGTYTTPNHYHITLVHTYDVGKGFNYDDEQIAEWVRHYNNLRTKYDDRHARLKLDRWGNGFTFYVREAVVEGLPESDNLTGDPDLRLYLTCQGNIKQGMGCM